MHNTKLVGLIIAGLILVVGFGCTSPQYTIPPISAMVNAADGEQKVGMIWSQQQVGLWVNGDGKTMAVPDVAILRLGVDVQRKTVAEGQREAADAMDKVMKVLKSSGIADKDIQTQTYNIYPVRRWNDKLGKEELIGYRVTNIVVAKIRKISEAGRIIDAASEVSGDITRIDGISFIIDNPTPYYTEARKKALEDAMTRASQVASVSGIKLGKLIYVTEGTSYIPQVRNVYKADSLSAAPAAPTSISAGELEIQVTVQMVYDIR